MSGENYNPNSVDATLSRIEHMLETIDERTERDSKRIDELEHFRWVLAGFAATIGAICSIVFEVLVRFF